MTLYTTQIQDELVEQLNNHTLTTLDFSFYQTPKLPSATLAGHTQVKAPGQVEGVGTNATSCVAVLPNGQVVSGGIYDNAVKIWNVDTGECLVTFKGHTSQMYGVAALSNSQVVSANYDKTLKIWGIDSGQCIHTLNGHTSYVMSVIALPGGRLVSASGDSTLRVWDANSGLCLKELKGHAVGAVYGVAALPNGQIVSASQDMTLKIWDTNTGECLKTLNGHANLVMAVASLHNGQIVSASADTTLKIWSPHTGECLKTLRGHTGQVQSVTELPDGLIASICTNKTIKIWDINSGDCIKTFNEASSYWNSLAALPNGQLVSVSTDGSLKIWTLPPRLNYEAIAPVLGAISPFNGLKGLSLQYVNLGQAGFEHVLHLVQTLPSLKEVNVSNAGLSSEQENEIQRALQEQQRQKRQRKAEKLASREQIDNIRQPAVQIVPRREAWLQFSIPINKPVVNISSVKVPKHYLCPITQKIMISPVIAKDGHTYEEEAIKAYFQDNPTKLISPITKEPLTKARVLHNFNLRSSILEFLEANPEFREEGQSESVYFSRQLEEAVSMAIQAGQIDTVLSYIEQDKRLLTRHLTEGLLIEQVLASQNTELLSAVLDKVTPDVWAILLDANALRDWLANMSALPISSLQCHIELITVFLNAVQSSLDFNYSSQMLIEQGLHQSSAVLLITGLIQLGGVNTPLDVRKNTALHRAAFLGDISLVAALVRQGAGSFKNTNGYKPKETALLQGHTKIAEYLNEAKIQPRLEKMGVFNKIEKQNKLMRQMKEKIQQQDLEIKALKGELTLSNPVKCLGKS